MPGVKRSNAPCPHIGRAGDITHGSGVIAVKMKLNYGGDAGKRDAIALPMVRDRILIRPGRRGDNG